MKKDHWVQAALTNDAMVAELLLRLNRLSSDSDSNSLRVPPPPPATQPITTILPPRWGRRKNRSKPTSPSTTVTKGLGKEQHRASPTTHLSWSGGSTSDGYDESSRQSDLSSGGGSVKANEGTSTSSCNKSEKRKSFVELKDEEGSLLKERIHINKELASMRMTLNQQVASNESLKRIKTGLDQKPRNKNRKTGEHERELKAASLVSVSVKIPCRVEAETETEGPQRGFVLPDLNMTLSDEDLAMMS